MSKPDALPYNATVLFREEINPQLVILRVRQDAGAIEFKPGQFVVLGLMASEPRVPEADPEEPTADGNRMIRRAYSIASASVERQHLEFYLTLVNSGELTPRLFALRPGQRLLVTPKPSGLFTMDRVAAGKAVVLIATGTGLAPYMSMLRTLLMEQRDRRFVVMHGARYSWDLGYRAELESLALMRPNFTYIPAITRQANDAHFQGRVGRIQNLIDEGVLEAESHLPLDPARVDVFLCGNPDMITAVKSRLQARGFVADHGKQVGTLHVEEYW